MEWAVILLKIIKIFMMGSGKIIKGTGKVS
jgi:hypothetical protein